MQADYKAFVDRMIDKYEGGYCWDKGDPGGPTNFGITCYDLAEHRGKKMTSMAAWAQAVHDMPRSEAEAIYAQKYAVKIDFNHLNPGPDCALMDYAVNSGFARASRVACALVGLPASDTITPQITAAVNKKDPTWFVDALCTERLDYMHHIRNGTAWQQFGKGWGARVADLKIYGEHLAASKPASEAPPAPDLSKVPTPKADHSPPNINPNTTGGGGAVIAGGGTVAHAMGFSPWWIAAGVTVVVVGGIAYVVYQQYKADKANKTVVLPTLPPEPGVANVAAH